MITEFLIDCFFGLANGFLSLVPDITWDVNTSAWEFAHDVLDLVCYLLPMDTLQHILSLIVSIVFLRISIAFIRTLLGLIPFV